MLDTESLNILNQLKYLNQKNINENNNIIEEVNKDIVKTQEIVFELIKSNLSNLINKISTQNGDIDKELLFFFNIKNNNSISLKNKYFNNDIKEIGNLISILLNNYLLRFTFVHNGNIVNISLIQLIDDLFGLFVNKMDQLNDDVKNIEIFLFNSFAGILINEILQKNIKIPIELYLSFENTYQDFTLNTNLNENEKLNTKRFFFIDFLPAFLLVENVNDGDFYQNDLKVLFSDKNLENKNKEFIMEQVKINVELMLEDMNEVINKFNINNFIQNSELTEKEKEEIMIKHFEIINIFFHNLKSSFN